MDVTKLKAFAADKLDVAKMTISVFDGKENTKGTGKNAGFQHFLHFQPCFQKLLSLVSLCGKEFSGPLQMTSNWTSENFCHLLKKESEIVFQMPTQSTYIIVHALSVY